MKKERNATSLFEDETPDNQLTRLKRERLAVQANIYKAMDKLSELNQTLKRLNAEIDVLEKQIDLFQK